MRGLWWEWYREEVEPVRGSYQVSYLSGWLELNPTRSARGKMHPQYYPSKEVRKFESIYTLSTKSFISQGLPLGGCWFTGTFSSLHAQQEWVPAAGGTCLQKKYRCWPEEVRLECMEMLKGVWEDMGVCSTDTVGHYIRYVCFQLCKIILNYFLKSLTWFIPIRILFLHIFANIWYYQSL